MSLWFKGMLGFTEKSGEVAMVMLFSLLYFPHLLQEILLYGQIVVFCFLDLRILEGDLGF